MRTILFVDDQREILNSHREAMKKFRGEVDTHFTAGAETALELLKTTPVDVVVTDMHMPGMDGATLLGRIKEDYPAIVRLMLCPQTQTDTFFVALPVSHQVLAKPLNPDLLCNTIDRIFRLRDLLTDSLRKKIGGVKQLPSVPTVYLEMMSTMERPDASATKIARILERDTAMAAKTLQLVNSAIFSLPRQITSLDQAVAYLGMELIRDLSLTVHMFAALEPTAIRSGFSFNAEQRHSLMTAKIAKRLVTGQRPAQNAFTAGLLHDIGKLVMAVCIPDQFKEVRKICKTSGRATHEVEAELLGVTHAEVGAYLLSLWGLPHSIVEAVAFHHNPSAALENTFDLPTAVSLANALVDEFTSKRPFTLEEHLKALNVEDRLPRWRTIAQQELQPVKQLIGA